MNADSIDSMKLAIQNKDLAELVRLVELKPELWGSELKFFHESDSNEFAFVTFLRKLTIEGLTVAFSVI